MKRSLFSLGFVQKVSSYPMTNRRIKRSVSSSKLYLKWPEDVPLMSAKWCPWPFVSEKRIFEQKDIRAKKGWSIERRKQKDDNKTKWQWWRKWSQNRGGQTKKEKKQCVRTPHRHMEKRKWGYWVGKRKGQEGENDV